jgi:transcriptional regulator with XRE-family HTH domain
MADFTDAELLRLIGERISKFRKAKGLSQADLAAKVGMEKPNLSVIENGRTNPQLLTLARIAAGLGVTLSDLLTVSFDYDSFSEAPSVYSPRKHPAKE